MEHISIPGLHRIAAIRHEALPPLIRNLREAGMTAHVAAVPVLMDHFGDSQLEWEINADGKRSLTLSFSSLMPLGPHHTAFVVEDRMHNRWLVGAAEPPFPKVTVNATSGKGSADTRAMRYAVEWEGTPIICDFPFPSDPAV